MRKTFVILALLALALPVAALSSLRAGEGTLSVEDGRGTISIKARGGVIGRLDRGSVTIYDLTPEDANDPYVFGDDELQLVGDTGIRYAGAGLRFRLVGGSFRIVITGRGIDVSAVGKGNGSIRAELESLDPGVYSLDGIDCRKDRADCKTLPERLQRFQLGTPERNPGPPTPS
ncbi:MAG TPA: hypothetical protein VIE18_04625 [Gaiellaceae bacterium]|jgi:hypothetical protein